MTGRLYYLRRWRRASRASLARNPLCRMCEAAGRVTLATVTTAIGTPIALVGGATAARAPLW